MARTTLDPRRVVESLLQKGCAVHFSFPELKDGKNQWSSVLMVFGVRRSPQILWWPMRSGLTKSRWMAARSTGLNLSRRSRADPSSTASLKGKSLSLLRLMTRTASMFELACTNTAADHLLCSMGSFISPTSLISGFIGTMLDNDQALSRRLGRVRFDMQMAS